MQRRQLLRGLMSTAGVGALTACATTPMEPGTSGAASTAPGPGQAPWAPRPAFFPPILAQPDRLISVTVCTRPFRDAGPRIEAERAGDKTVVHNYGHGGSGWSLSWGSGERALALAQQAEARELAVIGCGAIGVTTSVLALRKGLPVTIYADTLPPDTRSMRATGVWSPNSRFCTQAALTPTLAAQWEQMARRSYHHFQSLLGLPGDPIEWYEGYRLSSVPFDQLASPEDGEPVYPELERERTPDLQPRSRLLAADEHPFPTPFVRQFSSMQYNLAAYMRLLMDEFFARGGKIVQRHFDTPADWANLPQAVIVNCTGYGARALLGDSSITPVRGQLAKLIPQPEMRYGLYWQEQNVSVVPRRDGIIVQHQGAGDFGSDRTIVDRSASEAAVQRLATLFA